MSADFTAKAGSTAVTIKASALQKLIAGAHIVTVNFDDGKAAATITVILNQQQVENPETGDDESDTYGFCHPCGSLYGVARYCRGVY